MVPKKIHWLLLEVAGAPTHDSENCRIKEKEPRLYSDFPIQTFKMNFRVIK